MKFITATIALGLAATVAALPQASETTAPPSTITSAPVSSVSVSVDPVYSSVLSCIASCKAGDVMCQAKCQGLPTPDEGAVNATHDCIAACPPGGDDEKNAAWAVCQQKCVTELYWTATQRGVVTLPTDAAATTAGDDEEATPTGSDAEETGASATDSEESASQTSGSPSASETPNAASSLFINMPMVGAFGLFLGALAL